MNEASSGQGLVGQMIVGSDEPVGGYAPEESPVMSLEHQAIAKMTDLIAFAHQRIAALEARVAQLISEKL